MPGREHGEKEDLTLRDRPLDLQAARERLRNSSGKQFWRSLEELSGDPHFEELLYREFPRHASEWSETDSVGRRDFLKLMAASLALAGISGCARRPNETILPYVKAPEGLTLGKPLYFATAMPMGASALGLLLESHEGRPTKIEGNPDHPASLGATDVFAQAAILGLYDPDRSQVLTYLGEIRAWSAFLAEVRLTAEALKANRGAGFRILTGSVVSPTLGAQLKALLAQFPGAKWHQWEPAGSDGAREGARLAFGRYVNTIYRVEKADVILSLDADFLASGPGGLRYAREFARRRNPDARGDMNRLYVVEPTPSVTGAAADHRLRTHHPEVEAFAYALAGKLGLGGTSTIPDEQRRFLDAVTGDLQKHRGSGLVVAGEQQPAAVHALAHTMNQALGNVGSTVVYIEPVEAQPTNQLESLRELAADMDAGKVDMLLILGGNPVYDAPADFQFAERMRKVRTNMHLGLYDDETSQYCQWHIPEAHFLEFWGDARAFDGTASIIQPLIAPLYHGKTAHEVLAAFSDKPEQTTYELVRGYWKSQYAGPDFETFWRKSLNDGVVGGTASTPISVTATARFPRRTTDLEVPWDATLEVVFRPDPSIYDGRFANNGWLQEVPKPISKLTWDNAAMVSPATAEKLGLSHRISATGGEHGQVYADVVDVHVNGSKVTAAAWILPGQADGVITLHLGYGRTRAGHAGTLKGFSAYAVRASGALWSAVGGVTIRKTGETYPLACTQYHSNIANKDATDRGLLRASTLSEYRGNPGFARGEPQPPKSLTLYKEFEYPGYAWGMAIDLNACIGCNSCVMACQSENNIPVVGKSQVLRGREMHWIRIDRYFGGRVEDLETYFQPVPCMQCENAPCEEVCPVGATVHSAEGLNDMVYNRCIGTRYCSNNCPYKVRRFNFLRYQDWETPSFKLMRNPEVTVRSRGVMEKCTYCVQRINSARIESEKQNRPIRDGEIVTACQASCPAEAIVFGNANDPASRVSQLKARHRNYSILADLNTRPRTTYLAAVRNPNPELESPNSGKAGQR